METSLEELTTNPGCYYFYSSKEKDILIQDHRKVDELFNKIYTNKENKETAKSIIEELIKYNNYEEELLYPFLIPSLKDRKEQEEFLKEIKKEETLIKDLENIMNHNDILKIIKETDLVPVKNKKEDWQSRINERNPKKKNRYLSHILNRSKK
jgi:hypothetical protein